MNAPCYKCQEREHLCHAKCERYKVFAKGREQAIAGRDKKRIVDEFCSNNVSAAKHDLFRRRRK